MDKKKSPVDKEMFERDIKRLAQDLTEIQVEGIFQMMKAATIATAADTAAEISEAAAKAAREAAEEATAKITVLEIKLKGVEELMKQKLSFITQR